MRILGSIWRFRRLIVAVVALMVLTVTLDVHPTSPEFSAIALSETNHTHDRDGESGTDVAHKGIHHDHHSELAFDANWDFGGPVIMHIKAFDQSESRRVSIALDRPPDAALC